MSDSKRQFQIHLPGLLRVLAENLYSSKKVAIRELIQNAHDSCIRRSVEHKAKAEAPRVDIWVDADAKTITIEDNGSGLTEEEVGEYLSTIGRSYTRQLGENLSFLSPEQAEKLIGQFGLGFLSAFLIASEVKLTTQSVKDGAEPIMWRSTGDVHYDVTPYEGEHEIGTRVELTIKPAATFLLNKQVMIETVQGFADFVPVPVHVEGEAVPANSMTPPWESVDPEIATREYIARKYGVQHPLAVIPLTDYNIDLGHDEMTVPMSGFLFIPPGSVVSLQEYGDLSIYIRRMFICDDHRSLMPAWARFVRGVIDCPHLQPTASREDIRQEDMFNFVRQAIEEQLTTALKNIAENEPKTWREIVRRHRSVIMGWAVKNDDFFDHVADIVTFRTTRGQMNLPDYLDLTDNTLYYVTHELGSKQEKLLGEGYGVPIIDASRFVDPTFLDKYALYRSNVHLVQLDDNANKLFRSVPEGEFTKLLAYYRDQSIRTRLVAFKPESVPAVMVYPKDAEFIRDTRDALDAGEVPGPFAGMVGAYLNNMSVDEEAMAGTLHLNASNELVRRLAGMEDDLPRNAALDLIYQMARLFSGRMLETDQISGLFEGSNAAITALIAPDDTDIDDEEDGDA
ncbi:MAG: ATP-binding protein [Chloroflexota bacterium]